jgi:hypothetical protein
MKLFSSYSGHLNKIVGESYISHDLLQDFIERCVFVLCLCKSGCVGAGPLASVPSLYFEYVEQPFRV